MRAAKLQQRGCSSGFNPITGEKDVLRVAIPNKPEKPVGLAAKGSHHLVK